MEYRKNSSDVVDQPLVSATDVKSSSDKINVRPNLTKVLSEVGKAGKHAHTFYYEFKRYVITSRVVDTGIAYVMGRSLQYMVRSFVNDILIPPLLCALPGAQTLNDRFVVIRPGKSGAKTYSNLQNAIKDGAITINYGRFAQETISFFTVAVALFQLLHVLSAFFKWNLSFDDRDCPYCLSVIPNRATRCRHCTADLTLSSPETRKSITH
ncbi:hypothetical protein SmJEL517_g03894 [Synchytrium microbalum]|uniref:Large conductance mechanosensitive channel protein n=1 Tax=Synchytrium microbalum TaxID=1806994 RepID=A0A507C0J9_9FUNG|nr:uncharacterized protein SmJEL517_g03894 [Synchytrium microbalum]TPX33212.1 hypothetical protein SmJEL517_g03894 [Synchytrium microbalum]